MQKYHKIQTIYLRNPETKYKTLLENKFAKPEFEYLVNNQWRFDEKIDGTNIRVHIDFEFGTIEFGGRTDKAQIPIFLLEKLQELFTIERVGKLFIGKNEVYPITLYGEGYGARIQKGGGNYIPDGVSFILFDVMINDNYLERENVIDIAQKLEIDTVPIVEIGTLYDAVEIARSGFQSKIGLQIAEGLICRPLIELNDRRGNRIITKIKYKDFLR